MCRCSSNEEDAGAFYAHRRERKEPLKIRAFYLRLSLSGGGERRRRTALPETLTLVYLPRINGSPVEVNGVRVRPDAPAFVSLHRIRSAEPAEAAGSTMVFGSTDRVRVGEGVRFEAYAGEERAVKGIFRRREGGGWGMECGCGAAAEEERGAMVAAVEVSVVGDDRVLMREKVEMAARRRRRERGGGGRRRFCSRLEEIPEELGEGYCDCCGSEGEEEREEKWELVEREQEEEKGEVEEGMMWAVDLGIWAVCLGVGFLVSKASYKRRGLFSF